MASIIAAGTAGCSSSEDMKPEDTQSVNPVVHEEEVVISGLDKEFKIMFLADTHISLCDDRDPDLIEKALARYEIFRNENGSGADVSFREMISYIAEEQPDLLILGGDIVDSAMWASIDLVQEQLDELQLPWIYGMGNHDFEYGSEYYTEKAYTEYLPRLSSISGTQNGYQLIEYERFIVLVVDDESNRVSPEAADITENLAKGEKPVILVTHVPIEPLADDVLWETSKEFWGASEDGRSRVLLGPNSCYPDESTRRFLDSVLMEDSSVALVLAGHIHFYHRDELNGNLVQVVTGAGFENELVKVTLKPLK